ncbi:hypothetical protein TWF281_006307 [Arthrobotrys megalospora]
MREGLSIGSSRSLYFFIALLLWLASTRTFAHAGFWSYNDVPPGPPQVDDAPNLVYRQLGPSTNFTNSTNELSEAELLVLRAQEEAGIRNKFIKKNVRRNKYEFPEFNRGSIEDDPLATGVNETIAEAAATVAEQIASNSSSTSENILEERQASTWWMEQMTQNGKSPYVSNSSYSVWRNVKSYGAYGDGVHDDTAAINKAILDGGRCGQTCGSSTTLQAVVYFPSGTYLVSSSIIQYYHTQFIGNPLNRPIIKASASFVGLGVVSSNVYIEGGNGASWYIPQSNFLRQIRNFVIDITSAPKDKEIAALHWQVAQATSLQNIKFIMSTAAGNNQQGIFMENGSGGFLSDLEFEGGAMGAYVGNQQFTVRNLKFKNHAVRAIHIHWDWGWTWKGLDISNCPVGILMSTGGPVIEVGSALFIDSKFTNVPVGISVFNPNPTGKSAQLGLFNLATTNVPRIVEVQGGSTILPGSSGSTYIKAWGLGKRYDTATAAQGLWQNGAHFPSALVPVIPASLLQVPGDQSSGYFQRSKPQYETVAASNFINAKSSFGAVGNGVADDTNALNNAFSSAASTGKILWIPAGVYVVTNTIFIPKGTKVVGQSWPQIMGAGTRFQNAASPYPVIKVGNVGDVGDVEIQDLMFTVRGKTAGAIILQWNIHEASRGSAAMWDTHIRVGGQRGSDLQVGNCPKKTGSVNPSCIAAALMVHITSKASGYFENTWFWVADHDLDIPAQTQIDIYVARGFLIESSGPVWLYGTASEHCVLYQYQTVDASNVFMGMIQTEEPYYQVAPKAPAPFESSLQVFPSDPTFSDCTSKPSSKSCAVAWGVRVVNSHSILIYGAGLYSWFSEYTQECLVTENCQDKIFEIKQSANIWIYSLITKASVEMISPVGGTPVIAAQNHHNYGSIVLAWFGSAVGGSVDIIHRSPESATVIPFPGSTVASTATFTIKSPVVTYIAIQPFDGNQNIPPGPGDTDCIYCDLARLITSTCCGTGGSTSNPIKIEPGVPIPVPLILPEGFIPNQPVTSSGGIIYPAGQPLPDEVVISVGYIFPFPFDIPRGYRFSDRYTILSDDELGEDDGEDIYKKVLYITSTFWNPTAPKTIRCSYPCTIVFPPMTSTTTWTPLPRTTTYSGTITTFQPPPITSVKIRVSKTTVTSEEGSSSTKTILPILAPVPLCILVRITLPIIGTITISICPPSLNPFPPINIPIPPVTIIPVPPGPPGPTETPTPDHEQSEREEPENRWDNEVCLLGPGDPGEEIYDLDDGWDGWNEPVTSTSTGAGIGTPTTTVLSVPPTTTRTTTPPSSSFKATDFSVPPTVTNSKPPPPTPIPGSGSVQCHNENTGPKFIFPTAVEILNNKIIAGSNLG